MDFNDGHNNCCDSALSDAHACDVPASGTRIVVLGRRFSNDTFSDQPHSDCLLACFHLFEQNSHCVYRIRRHWTCSHHHMHPVSVLTFGIFLAGYITARWDLITQLYELAIFAWDHGVVVCFFSVYKRSSRAMY